MEISKTGSLLHYSSSQTCVENSSDTFVRHFKNYTKFKKSCPFLYLKFYLIVNEYNCVPNVFSIGGSKTFFGGLGIFFGNKNIGLALGEGLLKLYILLKLPTSMAI